MVKINDEYGLTFSGSTRDGNRSSSVARSSIARARTGGSVDVSDGPRHPVTKPGRVSLPRFKASKNQFKAEVCA